MAEADVRRILSNPNDYYAVLLVPRDADDAIIRRSYYRLTLKLHPDKCGDDKDAAQACLVVMRAYEVLKDSSKRSIYNMNGEAGVRSYESCGETMPSAASIAKAIGMLLLLRAARMAAARSLQTECVNMAFPWASEAEAAATGAEGNGGEQKEVQKKPDKQAQFAERHRNARAAQRRSVTRGFGVMLLMLLLLLVGSSVHSRWWNYRSGAMRGADTDDDAAAAAGPCADRRFTVECVLHRDLYGVEEQDRAKNFLFDLGSLKASGGGGGGSNASKQTPPTSSGSMHAHHVVKALRFGGTEEDGRAALAAYIPRHCDEEELLLWASRERYMETATLRRASPLPTPLSPNVAAKRKYAERRWAPKFEEDFSVMNAAQLFVPSRLCVEYWKVLQHQA